MQNLHAAERVLVTALAVGEADPRDLTGRLRPTDFQDPAARALFETAVEVGSRDRLVEELPRVLARSGRLRGDGYPLSQLLEWMPHLPVPAHPGPWAALVVAGGINRQVQACGVRLQQAAETAFEGRSGPGRMLAMAAAQRAVLSACSRRWQQLPADWRDSAPRGSGPDLSVVPDAAAAACLPDAGAVDRERTLLAGLVAAPRLLGRVPWLQSGDFTDPVAGRLLDMLRSEHESGRPTDVVLLAAASGPGTDTGLPAAQGLDALSVRSVFPSEVPFLARRVVGDALIRGVHQVGADLQVLADQPVRMDENGLRSLRAARQRVAGLGVCAVRWASATGQHEQPVRGEPVRAARLRPVDRDGWAAPSRDRHAG